MRFVIHPISGIAPIETIFSGQKDLIFLGQNHTKRVTVVLGLVFLWCATHYANLSKLSAAPLHILKTHNGFRSFLKENQLP